MTIAKRVIDFVMDILETITFVGSLFIVVYLFLFQPHNVNGASMDNTFKNGDYILTSKIAYRLDKPMRGDVIVFSSPQNPDIDFIKRIIGEPGERIRIENGLVFIDGKALNEPYTSSETTLYKNGFIKKGVEVTVPEDSYFVLGDNRARSSDSRQFGFIPRSTIVGKVFFRYFPANKMGPINNPFEEKLTAVPAKYFSAISGPTVTGKAPQMFL